MKADPDVKMISAEAPILFAKGCDIFITELTMRAWIHAEENKRRTLQRSDIASALAKSDMFDFLIDIVPREEAASHSKRSGNQSANTTAANIPPPSGVNNQMPPQNSVQQPPPQGQQQQHPQHPLGHSEYPMGNSQMGSDQEYRQSTGMYAPQVPQDPSGYGQPPQQIFGGADMYYAPMAASAQQQIYQVDHPRGQNPAASQNPGAPYQRHDGGEGDADAEGERDYEVG